MSITLIATCPHIHDEKKVNAVFANPHVYAVRYNTGSHSLRSIDETVQYLSAMSDKYGKHVWIDIKGRQLRVTAWADPYYEHITLNHNIELVYPARIYFRNSEACDITHVVGGNKLVLSTPPKVSVGAGQSVNILAKELRIEGYLTETDKKYLAACAKYKLHNIMASYVESIDDHTEIKSLLPEAIIISKIESARGIENIIQNKLPSLMAARDDLFIELHHNSASMLGALTMIVATDPDAICASKLFTSLEHNAKVDWNDFADFYLMYKMGYNTFMLCDNVCNYRFEKAIEAWDEIKRTVK